MNPNPLSSENHLTVPVATDLTPLAAAVARDDLPARTLAISSAGLDVPALTRRRYPEEPFRRKRNCRAPGASGARSVHPAAFGHRAPRHTDSPAKRSEAGLRMADGSKPR